jgi:hypothetical protein
MLPRTPGAATDAAQSVPMTPPAEADDLPWLDKIDWVLLGLLIVLSFLAASMPAYNADVWLHLATGRLIAHGDYFPGGADPFSCATEAGDGRDAVPWVNHSWLYTLGLYLVYSAFGGMGAVIVKASLIAVVTIVLMFVRNSDTHRLLQAVCLTLAVLTMSVRLYLQPVIFSYLFLAITLLILHRAGVFDTGRTPPVAGRERWLWGLPILCVFWVNVDNWFVLGPIVVALSWAGLALMRWRGLPLSVPVGRLGWVLGACVLACLISPFHVRVFQLPPELAYLVVAIGDRIGVTLPDAIAGGGRTLAILHDGEPGQLTLTVSPLAAAYLNNPGLGYSIAGICFFPLLGLSLLSFLLNGLLGNRPGAPGLQPARFLVWLFFAASAVLLYRLIPFFAIVAGPITALNLGELLAWYTQPTAAGVPETPWVAPVRLARLLGVLVLTALLLLAWPGWLTGKHDFDSRNHVAWEIPADVSMQKAAERLAAIQAQRPAGAGLRVFSTGRDLHCYCAWFAPGVKGFFDPRYNLFPHVTGDWLQARQALDKAVMPDKKKPATDWSSVLQRYRLDHVAVEPFLTATNQANIYWWMDPGQWLQQFADKNVAVFAWSGPQPRWRGDAVLAGWNRLAFGPVAPADRPPPRGMPHPPENRPLLDRYLEPPPLLPQSAYDMDIKVVYGKFSTAEALRIAGVTLPKRSPLQILPGQVLPMYSVSSVPLTPGGFRGPWMTLAFATTAVTVNYSEVRVPLWTAVDMYPPSVPILLTRSGWRTVAAASENERSYVYLANAIAKTQEQEEMWVDPIGFRKRPPPPTLRSLLRRTQLIAALRDATEIGFSDPSVQYQVHRDLAELYLDQQILDLASMHFGEAEKAWDDMMTAVQLSDPRQQEAWREQWAKNKKSMNKRNQDIETEVTRRKRDFDLRTATRKPMDKIREAVAGRYMPFNKENKQEDRGPWGLTGMVLELLRDINLDALSPEEYLQWGQLAIDLLYKTGHVREAGDLLDKFQEPMGPRSLDYRVFRAGVQGNYDEIRKVLKERDRLLAEQTQSIHRIAVLGAITLLAPAGPGSPGDSFGIASFGFNWANAVSTWGLSSNEACNNKTLLATMALEAGETAEARRYFDEALSASAGMYFTERPIAERYATMLAPYHKK